MIIKAEQCIAIKNRVRCPNDCNAPAGLCSDCYSERMTNAAEKKLEQERRESERQEKEKAAAKKAKQLQRKEIENQALYDKIVECRDIESLRQLELKILAEFVTGESTIDPKLGSPIVQLLKHQAELLGVTKNDKGLKDPKQREAAINIAINMTPEQQVQLLGDFAEGMKLIEKQAKLEAIDVGEAVVINEQT